MRAAPVEQDSAGVIAHPPLILLATFLVGLVLHLVFSVMLLPEGWVQLVVGMPIVGMATGLVAWAARTMRRVGTDISTATPTTALAVHGPYRFSRNPIYLAMGLFYLGLAVSINALLILVLPPVLLAVLSVGVIAREERYLQRKFGREYSEYKSRVRRWF